MLTNSLQIEKPTRLLRRAGHAAFWFFFLKGIAWLAAPFVFYYWW